jgi:integrase
MNVNNITRADIKAIFTKLKSNGHNELGRRIFLQIRSILAYGVYEEIIEHNIGADFDAKKEFGERAENHHPILTGREELKDLLFSLDNYFGDFTVRQALRVMPYLAFRPMNIRFLEWDEVDFEKNIITIPADKMKMKRDFRCSISPTVRKIFKETEELTKKDKYVFRSSVYTKRPLSASTLNVALRKLGYGKDQIVSHSFRGIFSTIAHDNLKVHKCSSLAIENQLAHKDKNQIRDTYNASDLLDERVELMEWWDNYLGDARSSDAK